MAEFDNQQLIDMAHGMQQKIKVDLLSMIQHGDDPYDIIYTFAQHLEDVSGERGYAQHIIDNIRTVYGVGLGEKKPLADEIKAIEARVERIKKSRESNDFSEAEYARMEFAIKAHENKILQLKSML